MFLPFRSFLLHFLSRYVIISIEVDRCPWPFPLKSETARQLLFFCYYIYLLFACYSDYSFNILRFSACKYLLNLFINSLFFKFCFTQINNEIVCLLCRFLYSIKNCVLTCTFFNVLRSYLSFLRNLWIKGIKSYFAGLKSIIWGKTAEKQQNYSGFDAIYSLFQLK